MTEIDESLIEYPCIFPIKAMGMSDCSLESVLYEAVKPHDPQLGPEQIKVKESSKGRYVSVTLQVYAVNREQLDNIYRAITSLEEVIVAF